MKIVTPLLLLLLVSCDVILDEMLDCANNNRPVIDVKELPDAVIFEDYTVTITTHIVRDSNDDKYDYDFELIGILPHGIEFITNEKTRIVQIKGVATELGDFPLTLKVRASGYHSVYHNTAVYYDDGDNLCRSRAEQTYVLRVLQETSTDKPE